MDARLDFLHVVGPISDWPSLESERRLQEQVRDEARTRIGSMLRSSGVDAPLRVAVGGIVPTVTEEAKQEQADLVIIGRGAVSEPFGRLRTHAFGIIQRSPCPVLSV
jgi:nucleotide-binding universal stress UspA family protein